MIRRGAKWSFRLVLLFVVAVAVKKLLDGQKPQPFVAPAAPPRPQPEPTPAPKPAPVAAEPLPTEAIEEVEPEPDLEAAPEPEPAKPTPSPVKATAKKVAAAKRPPRTEPLKAKREAKRAEKAVRANRKAPTDVPADVPRSALLSWVEPVGDVCPTSHPIKAKLGSRVFRKPGMASYETSRPDRCYASEGAARRAGFNEAQR